jgi:hypothetical protein
VPDKLLAAADKVIELPLLLRLHGSFWHKAADYGLIADGRFRSEADMRRCHDRIASGPHDPLRS